MAKQVADGEAPPLGTVLFCKRAMGYNGKSLARGQVFKSAGLLNDERLYRLGYVGIVVPKTALFPCRVCGAEFIDQGLRDGHGREAHEVKTFVPSPPPSRESGESADMYQNRLDEWAKQAGAQADKHAERRDKVENDVAPLRLDNTAASRGVSA